MRDQLLPFAVDQATFDQWSAARAARRLKTVPAAVQLTVTGAAKTDEAVMRRLMQPRSVRHSGSRRSMRRSPNWAGWTDTSAWPGASSPPGRTPCCTSTRCRRSTARRFSSLAPVSRTRPGTSSASASPAGISPTTCSGQGLKRDWMRSIGSDPGLGVAWYRPIGSSRVFIEPNAGVEAQTLSFIQDDRTVATYRQTRSSLGTDIGVNIGRLDDIRLGMRLVATRRVGANRRSGSADAEGTAGSGHSALDARWPGQPGRRLTRNLRVGRRALLHGRAGSRRVAKALS